MPLQAFDQIFPEIAGAELRACKVLAPEIGVPLDTYLLREFYCNEPGCDCRRVLVQFIADTEPAKVAASVNFGWERAKYYRKWSRDPELWREMAGATLEPFAQQGPKADRFLAFFKELIQDRTLVAQFRRHYALVKKRIEEKHSP